MSETLQKLIERVESVSLDEDMFRIFIGDGKAIFGIITAKPRNDGKPDYYSISTIYDSIIDVNHKIQYSFRMAYACKPSESLDDHIWFGKPQNNETIAEYYVENMAFRSCVLWELLAQFCNLMWQCSDKIDQINADTFFNNHSQGKTAKEMARKIHNYFSQEDESYDDDKGWKGNHKYVKEYRNQFIHRNSPNVSTFSDYAIELRTPACFVLERVTEDYLQAIVFLKEILQEIEQVFDDYEIIPHEENNHV